LYFAAQALRSQRTGEGYISYVAGQGRVSTPFTVPPIFLPALMPQAFNELRDRILAESSAAVPIEEALASIAERHANIAGRTEPKPQPTREPTPPRKPANRNREWRDKIKW